MARTFGEKGEDDEDEIDRSKGACAGSPRKPSQIPSSPTPELQEPQQPIPQPDGEIHDEAEEGRHLYVDFFLTEIRNFGLENNSEAQRLRDADAAVLNHLSPDRYLDWTRAGRELRQMADAFARSKERECVRRRAQSIRLESLEFSNFLDLLQELFQGDGITRERIIVLFFFCADVAIEAIQRGFNKTFRQLMEWSLKYISTGVAQWVHHHGGWTIVLSSSLQVLYQVSACCAFIAVAVACVIYIRRNI